MLQFLNMSLPWSEPEEDAKPLAGDPSFVFLKAKVSRWFPFPKYNAAHKNPPPDTAAGEIA